MAVRKTEERALRKLFTIGYNRSYAVVLPIEHIRALGWRTGQQVIVKRQGKTLVIRDRK